MNRVTWLTIALLLLTLSTHSLGCSKDRGDASGLRGPDDITASDAAGNAQGTVTSSDRAETVTVHTSLVVEDVREAMGSLRELVSRHRGYVQEADFFDGEDRRAGLVARIPAVDLAAFRKALGDLGDVVSEAEKVDDVTEQRADIGARLRNARAQEKRLLELLSYQTGSLADVLAVEEELSRVRESIERIEARQKTLDNEIAYASVHVNIRARYVAFWKHPRAAIAHAAQSGVRAAWSFLVGIVVVVAAAGPTAGVIAVMAFVVFLSVRFLFRLRKRATAGS
jgi:hypothetical protein